MSELNDLELHEPFETFVTELQKEVRYLQNGGTSYRIATAELSLRLADHVQDIVPFLDKNSAKETVSNFWPELDHHRKSDVAKFLHCVALDAQHSATVAPEAVMEYVKQKRQTKSTHGLFKNKDRIQTP